MVLALGFSCVLAGFALWLAGISLDGSTARVALQIGSAIANAAGILLVLFDLRDRPGARRKP